MCVYMIYIYISISVGNIFIPKTKFPIKIGCETKHVFVLKLLFRARILVQTITLDA